MKLMKVILVCLLLSGCFIGTTQQPKFYTQFAISTEVISAEYVAFIGVNRIQLPKYIDRPQIVTHLKDSIQLNISESNRWAESPSILATRIVTENLNTLLPSSKVKINQLKGEDFDKIISVEIVDMDAILDDTAELVAWYTIQDRQGKILTSNKFTSTVNIGKTYDDLALGYSKLLFQLSKEIANILI